MIKILPSSLREKKRYVAFRTCSEQPLKREEVVRAIWNEVLAFFGENAASEINLWVMNFEEASQKGFLVCSHREVGKVKAALALVSMVNGKKVFLQTLGVSGTIKALKRKFLNRKT